MKEFHTGIQRIDAAAASYPHRAVAVDMLMLPE
jgi:hypothetical protein